MSETFFLFSFSLSFVSFLVTKPETFLSFLIKNVILRSPFFFSSEMGGNSFFFCLTDGDCLFDCDCVAYFGSLTATSLSLAKTYFALDLFSSFLIVALYNIFLMATKPETFILFS